MRRLVGPVLGLLLGLVPVRTTVADRSPEARPITLQAARPNPIFPAALIPFSIAPEVCRNKKDLPRVTMKVYDGLINLVATLTLRRKEGVVLDGAPLACGDYVAAWNGTINGGKSVALSEAVYLVRLEVDQYPAQVIKILVPKL